VVQDDELFGVVTARAISEALANDDDADTATVGRLARLPATVASGASLAEALDALVSSDATGIAVVDDGRLTGWLTHRALLRAVAPNTRPTPPPPPPPENAPPARARLN